MYIVIHYMLNHRNPHVMYTLEKFHVKLMVMMFLLILCVRVVFHFKNTSENSLTCSDCSADVVYKKHMNQVSSPKLLKVALKYFQRCFWQPHLIDNSLST